MGLYITGVKEDCSWGNLKISDSGMVYNLKTGALIGKTITVPESHGRLVDADVLASGLMNKWHTDDEESKKIILDVLYNVFVPILADTPTVIERED